MNIPVQARGALNIMAMAAAALLSLATHSVPVEQPWPALLSNQPVDARVAALHERARLALAALGQTDDGRWPAAPHRELANGRAMLVTDAP
jgi:hypothetical protein